MNFRQRLLAVLHGERPDVMPWFADLTYWYHAQKLAGALPTEYEGDEGFIKLHAEHNVGYYLGYASASSSTHENVSVSTETEGDVTTTRWQTPVGEIHGQKRFLPETASSAPTKWPVEALEDLRVLRYIADATRTTPTYERYELLKRLSGGQGHPTFGGMPGALLSRIYTEEDVRRQVAQIVEHHWEDGKFILGVADQVPPDADMSRLPMITDLLEELCR